MNERIRELLLQAREETREGNWKPPTSVWTERFAELIVKECAEICLEANDHKNILRHFGIK